jgi:hypothetical protein
MLFCLSGRFCLGYLSRYMPVLFLVYRPRRGRHSTYEIRSAHSSIIPIPMPKSRLSTLEALEVCRLGHLRTHRRSATP